MESYWPSPVDRAASSQATRDQRPLLGRLLLVPNQTIIQEQYEETLHRPHQPGDNNSIGDSLFSQPMSFKNNPNCDNFLMAPEETRRLSSTSNDSELSSHSSQSDLFSNEVFSACPLNKSTNLKCADRMQHREDYLRTSRLRGEEQSQQTRRRSSACSSDSDRSSWRMSGSFSDKRPSLLPSDSRRDSGQSSHSLRRNSSFTNYNDQIKTSGMELVPAWLKLLRLHKYTELMMGLSYEEMISLTEEQLEVQGVTKGARRKIVTNIAKLRDRPRILAEISAHLDREDCSVKKVLMELEILLKSPIKIWGERRGSYRWRHDSGRDSGAEVSEDDCEEGAVCEGARLVEMIITVIRKTCSILLLAHNTDVKNVSHFISLLDTCLGRDCFNNHHKQLLMSWKHKLNSIWMTSGFERRGGGSRSRSRMGPLQRSSSGGAYMDFPISHWSSHEESRDYSMSAGQHTSVEEEGLGHRKRLSLQNGECVSLPSKNLTHRYSLPILRPEINFEGNQILHEDNIWDNSMYKDGKNYQKRRPLYASREQDYEKQNDFIKKETNSMYKGDIKSQSTHETHLCPDQVSESELDSRLARLCLSVTKNALE